MADSNHDSLVTQFTDVTGATTERATFFLESANWQLQLALASFYENFDQPASDDLARLEDAAEDEDEDMGAVSMPSFGTSAEPSDGTKPKKEKKKTEAKVNASGARIVTYNTFAQSDDDDDDEESGQAFYAGGSERSGQQVLGPPRKNPTKDFVSNIFKSAQESGAEVVEGQPSGSSGSRSFVGTGYRLGQTDSDHVVLPDTRANRPQSIDPVILRLWRQGFTINEGELRTYDEKRNKEFLECIAKGQLPPELRQQGGNMVQVNMEDHRHEDFKQTAAKVKPFAGKGHTLGSPTPSLVEGGLPSSTVPIPSGSVSNNESNEKLANEELKVDASQPTTSIQIRLSDGSRLSGRFNHSHTINDLRRFIISARPQYSAQTFSLLTTFPSKELTDADQSIESAGLLNAAIMQRLK